MKQQSKAQARAKQSREQVQANKRINAVNGDTVMTLGEQLTMLTERYEQALSKHGSNHPSTAGFLFLVRSYSQTIKEQATDKAKAEAKGVTL
jgi:hypothetical protein